MKGRHRYFRFRAYLEAPIWVLVAMLIIVTAAVVVSAMYA